MPEKEKGPKTDAYGVRTSDYRIFADNLWRDPAGAIVDGILTGIDRLGGPTHDINALRDINAHRYSKPIGWMAGMFGNLYDKITGNEGTGEAWKEKIESSPLIIEPIPVRNQNYTDEQLDAARQLSNNGSHGIVAANYRKLSSDGKYGGDRPFKEAILAKDPIDMIQYSIGQSSGGKGLVYDMFDFNDQTEKDKKTNDYYKREAQKKRETADNFIDKYLSYFTARSIAPKVFSTSSTPNRTKVKTILDFNE